MRRYKGFTLVELMIVIAILGVIFAIAIPTYRSYVEAARTAEAKTNLSTIRLLEEQHFADQGEYIGADGVAAIKVALPGFEPGVETNLNYVYNITVTTTGGFKATATYKPNSVKLFFITEQNTKEDETGHNW